MKPLTLLVACVASGTCAAAETYHYDRETRASDFARDFFGSSARHAAAREVDMGHASAGVSTSLDCGKLDINANLTGEFNKLQEQIRALVPKSPDDALSLVSKGAMLTVCYAYPTVCAELRHDFLAMQANLNLRAQACRAIDSYIDSSADKGAKELRAEAQAECIRAKTAGNESLVDATRDCQDASGLPLRDFQAGLEKRFTSGKQKVLKALVGFAKDRDGPTYDFLSGMLGEIEVQEDGYWQPLFDQGLARPEDVASNFMAQAEAEACGSGLGGTVGHPPRPGGDFTANVTGEVISRRLTKVDVQNLSDLTSEDRQLACAALGRALGQVAARVAAARGEAVLASGLLNTAVPNSLRDEYRTRGQGAFDALRKAVESDQIPPLDDVRAAVGQLARATREKNRLIAARLSEGHLANDLEEADGADGCSDTLSCSGGSG